MVDLFKGNIVKQALLFSFLVYLTTNLLAPLLTQMSLMALDSTMHQYYGDDTGGFFLTMIIGLVLCIPSWYLLGKLTSRFVKRNMNVIKAKIILIIVSVLLFVLTLGLMNYHYLFDSNYWPSVAANLGYYPIVLILSITLYYNLFFGKRVQNIEYK